MNTAIAIGTQSFEKIRVANSFYVDKTQFIKEWWENKDDVTLITRPRRFGFYHGFVLGLIADAKLDYVITSNRESGLSRYDVVMEPRNKDDFAYVLEFKDKEQDSEKTLEDTVKNALDQIEDKDYDRVLIDKGISKERIRHYGFAFTGKQILIG